ncbi:threonine--tRNA ligase [Pycnococcus provasolii]
MPATVSQTHSRLHPSSKRTLAARRRHSSSSVPLPQQKRPPFSASASVTTGSETKAKTSQEAEPLPLPELPTNESDDELLRIRHSAAHILAMATQRLFPDVQVTIGPWIDNGFYYDFDAKEAFSDADLKKIKKEMQKIIRKKLPIVSEEVTRDEAKARIEAINEPYKLEILDAIKEEPITIYHIGEPGSEESWWDLCAGPHVEKTSDITSNAIDLEKVAGAYWRGDETRPMLQRVYGTAWKSKQQLVQYRELQKEAARRDHRLIGKNLDLFSIQEEAGGGLVFWHPKGAYMRHKIESLWKDIHLRGGYELIYSPHIAQQDLWHTSGHLGFYSESMFNGLEVDKEMYQLKPMNCPFHVLVYKDQKRSYRQLPQRWAELGTVYRYERSGTLQGLFRVRGFTQDDAHIFCLPNQVEDEILGVINLLEDLLSKFGFADYEVNLSTRPEKSVGSDEVWQKSEDAIRSALARKGWDFIVDEGGGAFYGPKIDIKIKDAIGRKWQCSTIQVDFNLPERFDLKYTDSDAAEKRPIMIHRAIFGSVERFFGILTENYAGDFPIWLSAEQMRILPVSEDHVAYAEEVKARIVAACPQARVTVAGGERLGKLIRTAEVEKVPLMCVVGDSEREAGALNVRSRTQGELGSVSVEDVIQRMKVMNDEQLSEF